jgi:hypothetical protein
MKCLLCALLSLGLGAVGLMGQTPAKSQTAAKNQPAQMTDQEKNIRAYIELLRSDTRKDRDQIVGAVMQLDAEDSAKFWPIFKEFDAEYRQYGDEFVGLIKNYALNYEKMTGPVADQLANKLLDLEQQRNNLKRKYYQKFKAALDPILATRFLQIENQLERIVDLQIASELPVIEGPARR